jgi:predicted MFS family arabinose efflux permease
MTPPVAHDFRRTVYWLAFGAFAVGTEGFMIAGLLPIIAVDTQVSVAQAGQLITVFALAYALSSPLLATVSAGFDRRRVLIGALGSFSVANFIAAAAGGFWSLMGARVALAAAAGLYMPTANALAGALAGPARRGRAFATVHAGITVAIAIGAPLGAAIAGTSGWRLTFASVGGLAAVVTLGLSLGLRRGVGQGIAVPTLAQRLSVARQPRILVTLVTTTIWAAGIWTIYPYIALFVARSTDIPSAKVGAVLALYGACALIGVMVGGAAIDRFGCRRVLVASMSILALVYCSLTLSARFLTPAEARLPVLLAIAVWGVAGFMFNPAQQTNLIEIAGVNLAPISLSLNGSFLYLGFSLGAALGGLVLTLGSMVDIGWVGASCELAALVLMLTTTRRRSSISHGDEVASSPPVAGMHRTSRAG